MMNVKIVGMGNYLPVTKVLSTDLDHKLHLPLGTVQQKSGLVVRHFATGQETTSYMAGQAALKAIQNAGLSLNDIDVIIGACGASEQLIPCTAVLVQRQLGLEHSGIPCFDVNSTCLSFISALDVAAHLIAGDRYQRALIVASELPSTGLNWQDMETCTIFGDGAAACIVEKSTESNRIIAAHMHTYSSGADYCRIQAGGTKIPPASSYDPAYGLFEMQGKQVFKLASQMISEFHDELFEKANVTLADIDWVIPHQASLLAMHHVRKRLQIPKEKYVDIYATHGNQMAASVPTALHHLIASQQLQRGQLVYLLGTGAGISVAGMILEY